MPELPEVELYARYFQKEATHRTITRVTVRDPRVLGATTPTKLTRSLLRKQFTRIRRHGKHLFVQAGETWLYLHFGMTGELTAWEKGSEEPRFAKVIFEFSGGRRLAFEDMRLFGVVDLVPSPDSYIESHGLGPDALDPTDSPAAYRARMQKRRGAIKPLLMSQTVVAGLGNLYVDETLFATAIHPLRRAEALTPAEVTSIYRTSRRILKMIIERKAHDRGYPAGFLVHIREEGERCPRCGGTIQRATIGGRTTYFCGKHQK